MTVEFLQTFLGWSLLINIALLCWWLLMFTQAHDWVYKMHSRWFYIKRENFDFIHYTGIAFYKLAIFMFNLVPYIVLRIVS